MADITIKKDDTRPALQRYLRQTVDGVESPIALTTAGSILFIMKLSGANPVSGLCSVVNAASGAVAYKWATGDTASAGMYDAEFEIAWQDGGYETVPNDGYFSIEIVADLGGTV
jgi:hypothetical protein